MQITFVLLILDDGFQLKFVVIITLLIILIHAKFFFLNYYILDSERSNFD